MKIQPAPSCSSANGTHPGRPRIVLLVAVALLLVGGLIAACRDSDAATLVVKESIVVEAESPRAVESKLADTYSVQLSDMRGEVSLFVTSRDGSAIPLGRLDAHASYAPLGGHRSAIALEPMNNDHLMAGIDPSRSGTLVVNLAAEAVRQELTFELPFSTTRRRR